MILGDELQTWLEGGEAVEADLQLFFDEIIYIYYIHWIYPRTQDASHHQDYSIFSRESRTKPLFVTVTGWGIDRIYIYTYCIYIFILIITYK